MTTRTKLRAALIYEGPDTPSLDANPSRTRPLWRDTSNGGAVLKMLNAAGTAWVAVEFSASENIVELAGKLSALDTAASSLTALDVDLDETVAKEDIDDAGAIDGTELAALISATHARINEVAEAVNALITALTGIDTED